MLATPPRPTVLVAHALNNSLAKGRCSGSVPLTTDLLAFIGVERPLGLLGADRGGHAPGNGCSRGAPPSGGQVGRAPRPRGAHRRSTLASRRPVRRRASRLGVAPRPKLRRRRDRRPAARAQSLKQQLRAAPHGANAQGARKSILVQLASERTSSSRFATWPRSSAAASCPRAWGTPPPSWCARPRSSRPIGAVSPGGSARSTSAAGAPTSSTFSPPAPSATS